MARPPLLSCWIRHESAWLSTASNGCTEESLHVVWLCGGGKRPPPPPPLSAHVTAPGNQCQPRWASASAQTMRPNYDGHVSRSGREKQGICIMHLCNRVLSTRFWVSGHREKFSQLPINIVCPEVAICLPAPIPHLPLSLIYHLSMYGTSALGRGWFM